MFSLKQRLKFLRKLGQTAPSEGQGSQSATGTPTTGTNTQQGAQPTATKNKSQPASSMMDLSAWGGWTRNIDGLVRMIDSAIIAGTKNKYNFFDLFTSRFPQGVASEFPPPDPTKDIISFAGKIYQQLMNSGHPLGRLQHSDMRQRVSVLLNAPELQKFQQINPQGPLGLQGVSLDSVRDAVMNFLNSIPLS